MAKVMMITVMDVTVGGTVVVGQKMREMGGKGLLSLKR